MSHSRRSFITRAALTTGALAAGKLARAGDTLRGLLTDISGYAHSSAEAAAVDEEFWHLVKQAYTVSPSVLNLNNGGVSPQPRVVQEAVERYNRLSNEAPSYYMWRVLDMGREPLRRHLARLAGCDPEEIAIDRNSSEAIETVIFGLRLKAGDEVILTRQDYPNMINAWKQRAHRDGVVLKWLDFNFPIESEDEIADKFVAAMTDRTKLVHVTHMINWNGQILPVRKIADAAHARGIEVLVDAAHTFAHLDYRISDLGCDYYGTSLHKWLCAPFGSGMLYVRKDKIRTLYPHMAAPDPESDDIRKFEHLGTRSFAIEQAIGQAVEFHEMIGSARKQARLQYLKRYWTDAVVDLPGVSIGTSLDPRFGCAIALLEIEGKKPQDVTQFLFRDHKIHTTAINWENIHGVRITPNVYTVRNDLDRLISAIEQYVRS
ncbi:MAG: aminotransferase class V-fold PLP-dependent enzyme [Saprospiraceae bacterium]|nr:aminotransferase class V-fold PLP-dependent enzyme [Saprospiraceae bacterium]